MIINKLTRARSSPFYEAYTNQKELIDSAIDQSIKASLEKIEPDMAKQLFSIKTKITTNKEAA
ncbi:hypothetical protein SAMN05216302_101462 [Nitrosomonas aestuarii]|uniref:Uncharacterized protein n=1 Tax=Nitrosomonas aestuarii TaxID=52441 RepID=A0A1I4C274_9PROT|nr:hypothetical protein [Nitrosomonas aestuarii]SFK75162.1 hypothetical protein SAMN05216302_101462 [Nitrosomonas aestuarii]